MSQSFRARLRRYLAEHRPERGWRRSLLAGAAVGLLAGAASGVVGRVAGAGDDGSSGSDGPEAALRDFFEARSAGDCDRLYELVSQDSRSRWGLADHDDFLASCNEVVGAFRPELSDVDVVREDGEQAVAAVVVPDEEAPDISRSERDGLVVDSTSGEDDNSAHGTARLVAEDGGWKLELDHDLLRIGRSPDQTLRLYGRARAEADCDALADLLSEDAWGVADAAGGADARDAFVERCQATTTAHPELETTMPWVRFEVAEVADDGDAEGHLAAVGETRAQYLPGWTETVTLVTDGLAWKLDRDTGNIAARLLGDLVVDTPAPGYEPSHDEQFVRPDAGGGFGLVADEGSDAAAQRAAAGFEIGVTQRFTQSSTRGDEIGTITILVYELSSDDGARTYAEHMTQRFAGQRDPRAPQPRAGLPLRGVHSCGSSTDCATASIVHALDVHGRYVVAVESWAGAPTIEAQLDRADAVLRAQMENL